MPHKEELRLQAYRSSARGTRFRLGSSQLSPSLLSPLLEDTRPFTYTRYAEEIHPPVPLPGVDTSCLSRLPRCLDMPIRLAGNALYHVPEEWSALLPLILQLAALEHAHNPHWQRYHTYLTLDCGWVEEGEQQRRGGLHVDGFQGERIQPKTVITRNYVVATNGGTRYYPQRFVVVDPARFNVFHGFDMQTQGWGEDNFQEAEEGVAYFMNAYSVHESGLSRRSGLRVFFRLTYDVKAFDRLGNTSNSMLAPGWRMQTRSVQEEVVSPDISELESSPYFPARESAPPHPLSRAQPLLIGLSGKPGSGKNWLAFRLLQELRFRGVEAGKSSLAAEVYREAGGMMDECQAGLSLRRLCESYGLQEGEMSARLHQHWSGELGVKHPQYGYHRRNQAVRQGMELLSELRRREDPEYWLSRMLAEIKQRGLQAAVFSDLRFPNEAEQVRARAGVCLRVELDPVWLQATTGRNPGYKYSQSSLNSPLESALDDYPGFFSRLSAQSGDAEALIIRILAERPYWADCGP